MTYNPAQVYRRNQFDTASPAELTMMLYNGAIRFLNQAKQAIEDRDFETANERIKRTQDIVQELLTSLDTRYDIGKQLAQMYDYIYYRLTQANVKKDTAMVDEAIRLISELREGWKEVVKLSRTQASVEVAGGSGR